MQREAWRSAESGGRHWTVFQPPIAHFKNYVRQLPIVQQASQITLCHELGFLGSGIGSMPFSTYSLSLALLVFVGRHDSEWISEDWHLYEKASLLSLGKAQVQRGGCSVKIKTKITNACIFENQMTLVPKIK